MGVPDQWIPKWIKKKLSLMGSSNNLNPFLKEKFRDVTCYYGAEYHQDSIDYSGSKALKSKLYCHVYLFFRCLRNWCTYLYFTHKSCLWSTEVLHEIDYKDNKIFIALIIKR